MPDKNGTSAPESTKEQLTQDTAVDSKASAPSAQAATKSTDKAASNKPAEKKSTADKQDAPAEKKPAAASKKAADKKPAAEKTNASKSASGAKSQTKKPAKTADKTDAKQAGKAAASAKAKQSKKAAADANGVNQGVRATAKYVRVAPRKARLVIDLIRNKPVEQATQVLQFSQRAVAVDVEKVLRSACANAFQNKGLRTEDLIVSQAYVDEGPTLKRIRPRAKGSASRINKRTSHITVVVAPRKEA